MNLLRQAEAARLRRIYYDENSKYFNAITSSTTTKKNIELQFEAVEAILEELFDD